MDAKSRAVKVEIGGEEHELLFTMSATIQIVKHFGSLDEMNAQLADSEHLDTMLDAIVYLLCLLANQSIALYNLRNKDNPRPKLTLEEVELGISLYEAGELREKVTEALNKGGERFIVSEEDNNSKNQSDE